MTPYKKEDFPYENLILTFMDDLKRRNEWAIAEQSSSLFDATKDWIEKHRKKMEDELESFRESVKLREIDLMRYVEELKKEVKQLKATATRMQTLAKKQGYLI